MVPKDPSAGKSFAGSSVHLEKTWILHVFSTWNTPQNHRMACTGRDGKNHHYVKSQGGAHVTTPSLSAVSKISRLEGNATCGEWGRGSDSSLGTWQVLLWLLGLCSCCQCWDVSVFWALALKQLCLEGRGNALWIERIWENANVSTEFNSTGLHCRSYRGKNALFTMKKN